MGSLGRVPYSASWGSSDGGFLPCFHLGLCEDHTGSSLP
ncbi:rCG35685 [Rattus norvegicus]|uniref:RCG35685 n=1 Tax=Rattus norvegicus TaxID=10116 RepID=A6IJS8_RAT|nr:rCG35685 [Rattus norvegicus]